MKKPLLIISYYAQNHGTTDYLLQFLQSEGSRFYYLKHPLPEAQIDHSTLLYYDGKTMRELQTYRSPKSFMAKLFAELSLNLWTSLKLRLQLRVKSIVGFGSINASSVLLTRLFGARILFWGVDYSPRRFDAAILNSVYLISETLACLGAHVVLQPTTMQESARVAHHHLARKKSIIIPNGINSLSDLIPHRSQKLRFIYIGSLTSHHGMLDFIKEAYGHLKLPVPLTIFGDGTELGKTQAYVQEHNLESLITFAGSRKPEFMEQYIRNCEERLIGIAPYNNQANGHVGFGDSLKLKEYVNLGMPFIASTAVKIDSTLQKFGICYNTPEELRHILQHELINLELSTKARQEYVQTIDWTHLFKQHFMEATE